MKLIAYGLSNWNYYLRTFADGSQAVVAIAKPGSGAGNCHYCSAKTLRAHFIHLANVKYDTKWKSMVPNDWIIVDKEFFEKLGIR